MNPGAYNDTSITDNVQLLRIILNDGNFLKHLASLFILQRKYTQKFHILFRDVLRGACVLNPVFVLFMEGILFYFLGLFPLNNFPHNSITQFSYSSFSYKVLFSFPFFLFSLNNFPHNSITQFPSMI